MDSSYSKVHEILVNYFAELLTDSEKRLESHLSRGEPARAIGERYREIQQLEPELETLSDELTRRLEVCERQYDIIQQRLNAAGEHREVVAAEAVMVNDLLTELRQIQASAAQQLSRARSIAPRLRALYDEVRKKELFERRTLPVRGQQRDMLMDGLAKAPQLLFSQLQLSIAAILSAFGELGAKDWIVFIAWASGLLLAAAALRSGLERLDRVFRQDTATPVVAGIVRLLSGLLRMNLLTIGFALIAVALSLSSGSFSG